MAMIPPHVGIAFGDLPQKLNEHGDDIPVPREILVRLLDLYISCWDFDEDWYLSTYPDVEEAVRAGKCASGWAHFRSDGYLEGRLGNRPAVDEDWYLSTYPDIANAVLEGRVSSASDHFVEFGYKEGRLPSNPTIYPTWYAPRYIQSAKIDQADEATLLQHFLKVGYHRLAVPGPPR